MSKPIITFSLSDSGYDIYVYDGDITKDEQVLTAIIATEREDCGVQLQDYLHDAIERALAAD